MEEINNNISKLGNEQLKQVSGGGSSYFPNILTVNTSGGYTELHNEPSIDSPDVPNSVLHDGDKVISTNQEQNNMKYVTIKNTNVSGWLHVSILR